MIRDAFAKALATFREALGIQRSDEWRDPPGTAADSDEWNAWATRYTPQGEQRGAATNDSDQWVR